MTTPDTTSTTSAPHTEFRDIVEFEKHESYLVKKPFWSDRRDHEARRGYGYGATGGVTDRGKGDGSRRVAVRLAQF